MPKSLGFTTVSCPKAITEVSFLHCIVVVHLHTYLAEEQFLSTSDSYRMNRLQMKSSLISLNLNLLSVICSRTAEAQTFQADAPPLWSLRCCHGNRGSGSLAYRHQSVSSILRVYFWVTGERLNVYALLAPPAPLKSKLEIGINDRSHNDGFLKTEIRAEFQQNFKSLVLFFCYKGLKANYNEKTSILMLIRFSVKVGMSRRLCRRDFCDVFRCEFSDLLWNL